jgi:hypothetical protein
MNCDIENRKSFDVNGGDFAYFEILQKKKARAGTATTKSMWFVPTTRHLPCLNGSYRVESLRLLQGCTRVRKGRSPDGRPATVLAIRVR